MQPTRQFFQTFACIGDSITWEAEGFTITARIEHDADTKPTDYDCYEESQIQAWMDDEWSYVGVVLSVEKNGVQLTEHAASLWGIECNFTGADNSHVTECAYEMEGEALAEAKKELERMRAALA